ncbi:MAG: DUF4058 family protein [Chloroflexota bacterium]|nr:DUF4058 family protein [Chloroflexota bacterium]
MPQSPFPGMDPYLEAPDLWPDVHTRLMNIFAEQLAPLLAPKYVAELDTQIVIDQVAGNGRSGPRAVLPDVTVTQPDWLGEGGGRDAPVAVGVATAVIAPAILRLTVPMAAPTRLVTLHIRRRKPDILVTVIELLSPVNKRPGDGRREYLKKRSSYLNSAVHFIEIDLLRRWSRMPFGGEMPDSAYLAVVSVARERPACDAWPIDLRDPLPVLPTPLLHPDPPVPLDMGQALYTAYQRARYDLRIDYKAPSTPPLSPEDAAWASALLEEVGKPSSQGSRT